MAEAADLDDVDEVYASHSASGAMDGRKLELTQRCEVRRRQIPPDGYKGFKKAMDAANDWSETTFRVEKGGRR